VWPRDLPPPRAARRRGQGVRGGGGVRYFPLSYLCAILRYLALSFESQFEPLLKSFVSTVHEARQTDVLRYLALSFAILRYLARLRGGGGAVTSSIPRCEMSVATEPRRTPLPRSMRFSEWDTSVDSSGRMQSHGAGGRWAMGGVGRRWEGGGERTPRGEVRLR